ncbi:type I restriction endonuclease subunit R [Bacteroidota bacterium]
MNYTEKKFEDQVEDLMNEQGWKSLLFTEYDRNLCQISNELISFLRESQQKEFEKLTIQYGEDTEKKLTRRIHEEIGKRGIIDVLRKGVKDRGSYFQMVFFEPKSGLNHEHQVLYKLNRFHIVRQLHYSTKNENSIDIVLFLNGLPLVTIELKNQLTGQTILDSEKQYRKDRDPKEPLLQFKRCVVHLCVDNDRVSMTTRLIGDKTGFLPYNKGIDNPINPNGHKSDYLWTEILTSESLLDILENFVHIHIEIEREWDGKQGKVIDKKKELLIFPRYHQLDVIRNIRTSLISEGVGHNYLIQHITGSGKSYSIGWLSHMLTSLYQTKKDTKRIFDTIIVITDRKVLDQQLQRTIKQLEQTVGVVNPIEKTSVQLREYLEKGKDIIITTIQKFPVISQEIGEIPGKTFGIVVDEVHSSQSGESSKHLKKSLTKGEYDVQEDDEFTDIDEKILSEIKSRGKQKHISFFGFTGTPKNKTLEIFGRKNDQGEFVSFHTYTMKQSITEGFTLDVLHNYTTYKRWFKLNNKEVEDRELPRSRVMRELVNFVDSHKITIKNKVRIILDHFVNHTSKKIGGRGRGMVVVRSRYHCVLYFHEMKKQMENLGLSYSCLTGYTGSISYMGQEWTESKLNQLENRVSIPNGLKDPRYRILIVNNKFQTGFDEPLIHSMYVDKKLSGLQCVQTLSRLNRTTTGKTDTFVLDFSNDSEQIYESFQPYYETTKLVGETNPNRLYSIIGDIENFNLYTKHELDEFCLIFYDDKLPDERLQPILNRVVDMFKKIEDENQREEFRSLIQSFIRLYGYISQIITFEDIELEKQFIFLKYLNKKLPKRSRGEDVTDILDSVNLDSFRIQKVFEGSIKMEDGEGELDPIEGDGTSGVEEEPMDLLSEIINQVNEVYGVGLTEEDKIDLQNVQRRLKDNQKLHQVMVGDNTETNKKDKFNEVMKDVFLKYVNTKFDFYKKLEDPKIKGYVEQRLYDDYKKHVENQSRI